MKKLNNNKILIVLLVIASMFSLVGCTNKIINSPEDAIKDAYGNTQFRISFDSTDLEQPISDMYYTANNMPILPTPVKVGYVFAGWYFDASLTKPCDVDSGDLLWKMKNLTLYPKWEEEKIFNNGTYDIEFNAVIKENTISKGPLADGFQKFPEDIVESETYIEKNDKGTFLRIQYDNVVRGPVLGSNQSDENNFSKMTYTVTDKDNRINKDISILDRTNTIQTIYYDISGLNISDSITLSIEYYNWKINLSDDLRPRASVIYEVEFKITRFIGFNQAFLNPEGKLENGIYMIPTHYTDLSKGLTLLDAFNPVYAYIEAKDGKYRLYKPLNTYNNDFPEVTPEQYPLRSSGYAREFACFHIDQNKIISKQIEDDQTGKYYLPELIEAKKYLPLTYELHADTGKYYYSVDLGNELNKDLVFIGGSAGAMEQMFSFPFSYRRLTLNYNSMVRLADWDYKPLTGDEYTFHEKAALYPGSVLDFKNSNTDFDVYNKYLQAINMVNCFFKKTDGKNKVFDTKMTIAPTNYTSWPMGNRYNFAYFDLQYSAFGYNPKTDGNLFARDLTFVNNQAFRNSNSSENVKFIGSTFKQNEEVNLNKLYIEKVNPSIPKKLTYKVYKTDNNLNVLYDKELNLSTKFNFTENIAVLFEIKEGAFTKTCLVYLMEEQAKDLQIVDSENNWTLQNGVYTTTKRYKIGENGDEIIAPEVRYQLYGQRFTTSGLKKYDEDDFTTTDSRIVSFWEYDDGKYTSIQVYPGSATDIKMGTEKVRVMMQLVNPFREFETILFEYRGEESGEYEIKQSNHILATGDINYRGKVRQTISHNILDTVNLYDEKDLEKIPNNYTLSLNEEHDSTTLEFAFKEAVIYLNETTLKLSKRSDIWDQIKNEKYAMIVITFSTSYGDTITLTCQFNFKLDAKDIDGYSFFKNKKTIFNYEYYEFSKPIVMTESFDKIDRGDLKVYKKNGFNYEETDDNDLINRYTTYSFELKFMKSGTYLITLKYDLYKDEFGHYIFNYNKTNSYAKILSFNICEEIEVVDKHSDMIVTYATDKLHPFNKNSDELIGFTFTEDDKYQYGTIKIKGNSKNFALTQKSFIMPEKPKDKLFVWSTNMVDETLRPGFQIYDLSVKTGTLNPILYAWWDSGVKLPVKTNIYGDIKNVGYTFLERDPYTGGGYLLFFSHLAQNVTVPEGYVIYGWEASKPIFSYQQNGHNVISNFHKGGYEGSVYIYEEMEFTAIIKKKVSIYYKAVDVKGNELQFMKNIRPDYDAYIKDKFNDVIDSKKLKELTKVSVTDTTKKFSHWEVFDKNLNKYVEVSLETFILEESYANNDSRITLRAVFK